MDSKVNLEKYRGLSVAALILGVLAFACAYLLMVITLFI
jgi:hypothetical protein